MTKNIKEINTSVTAVGYFWAGPNNKNHEQEYISIKEKVDSYCQSKDILIKKMFKDIGSTGNANRRSQVIEMLKYIEKNKINYLVLDSLSTLGRRFHDAIIMLSEFNSRNIGIISIDEEINTNEEEGKVIVRSLLRIPQIKQWTEQNDSTKKKIRVQDLTYAGGACPYGYIIDSKTNQYQVLEEEGMVVKRIFRERVSGRSLRQICNDLIKDGIATKRGGKWQANTIKTIIENPFYMGIHEQEGTVYKDCHDSIVTEYIFKKVNEMK